MTQTQAPLVSVIILNYKRRKALVRSLQSVQSQSYANRETIVVDNDSQDDIREYIAANWPEVRLIELAENRGAGGGRNAGIIAARGEIIITLDNDIFFESVSEITKTVKAFARLPDVHVIAYQLCDQQTGALRIREWCHPRTSTIYGETEFETNYFVEGACAARRIVYETAGIYYEPLFIGCEGWDLALRIIDKDFKISYQPQIRARHLMSLEARTSERPYYFYTRNYIWIAYKNYPIIAGISFLGWKMLMMLFLSFRTGHRTAFLRGVRDGCLGIGKIRRDRKPIRSATVQYLQELERWRPTLWSRLKRHSEAVQI